MFRRIPRGFVLFAGYFVLCRVPRLFCRILGCFVVSLGCFFFVVSPRVLCVFVVSLGCFFCRFFRDFVIVAGGGWVGWVSGWVAEWLGG